MKEHNEVDGTIDGTIDGAMENEIYEFLKEYPDVDSIKVNGKNMYLTPKSIEKNIKYHVLDARKLDTVIDKDSIHLVCTSIPYPLISMWDEIFRKLTQLPEVKDWTPKNIWTIFEKMHLVLDEIWAKLFIVVKEGGIVAINVGDATRSFDGEFMLFPNGARTTTGMIKSGFTPLPNIYWKKPGNKPNAFLGSGFSPVNAYVTLDCEHILIFRKGKIRKFLGEEKIKRKESTFTKEERNLWFSQTWTGINGTKQKVINNRKSAAFPEEIPERLIRMFSIKGDTVLDPFSGTGTTLKVAERLERKAIGIDIDEKYIEISK